MSRAESVLVGRALTRTFGDGSNKTTALKDISLSLVPGQLALILGPSGSGKSTLLAVLSGLLRPDGGEVRILGVDLWRLGAGQRKQFRLEHFGFIFQGYNLFPALTARQNLEIVLRWGKQTAAKEARRQAEETLAALGLRRQIDLIPAQLSGGEQQRVAIGRALVKQPAFCFADEPTAALDWAHGRQVIEMLRLATKQRGATVLLVTHDTRIIPYADRVFQLRDGELVE